MKKVFLTILFLLMALSVGASDDYTIAIVPYITNVENAKPFTNKQIIEETSKIIEMEIPDVNLKATNEVSSIFQKFILPDFELNKQQKINYLIKIQTQNIKEKEQELSDYYSKVANNNYQSIDMDKYNGFINDLKKQIKAEQANLEKFINQNNESDSFTNPFDIQLPTNIKDQASKAGDINVKVITDYNDCFLLSNYFEEYRNYFTDKNEINEILFVEVDEIANLNNLKIYYKKPSSVNFDKDSSSLLNSFDLIFDRIIANDSISALDSYILQSLVNSFYSNISIIKNEIPLANISIKEIISQKVLDRIKKIEDESETTFENNSVVYIDTDEITPLDTVDLLNTSSYILLEKGTHYLLINGTGIYPYVLKVESDTSKITSISTSGNPAQNGSLRLNSNIGKVNWIIDGVDFGFKNSLEIDNQVIPSTILIKKTNFEDKLLELNEVKSIIDLSLNPSWLGDELVFKKKQSDFYQGLLNYIIGCATFISIKTINNIYGDDTLKEVINNINDGVLILAQVNIVYQLVSYIKLATN